MSDHFEVLLEQEAFNSLTREQKSAFKDLAVTLSGKSAVEAMPVIMNFMKNMPKGHTMSDAEQNAMTQAALRGLPPADAARFQNMLKMMEMMKKK